MRVLICGGGVIGASIAYFLSRRGVAATVIERTGLACARRGQDRRPPGLLSPDRARRPAADRPRARCRGGLCRHRPPCVGYSQRPGDRRVARIAMCRNIKTLHNFKPPATEHEIRASSLQFVRKLSGCTRPSKANELAFNQAVDQVAKAVRELLGALVTNAPPRDREVEGLKAQARTADRFRPSGANRAT